ncbi:MAG TPA: hypothetical protein VGG45_13205 [Terracidiphilus sp.]|jgi:hypothetical protein
MKSKSTFIVSIAFTTCALVFPGLVSAQSSPNNSAADLSATPAGAQSEASQMVPAQAVLDKGIDAKKVQPGQQFRATLTDAVTLKNGTELPKDTVLVGTIATDQMASGGTSTLALRFTKAQLKSGKVLPIRADIMGITGPSDGVPSESYTANYGVTPWDGQSLRVDEPGAVSGFDLHSTIGGQNSAQFVSTKKDDVKLSAGSQIALAIAALNA